MNRERLLNLAKPILFNTEMVKAILKGRKTVTRRVLKTNKYIPEDSEFGYTAFTPKGHIAAREHFENGKYGEIFIKRPFSRGDILYVRETWAKDTYRYFYKANYADNEKFYQDGTEIQMKWKPSIHMPKAAARIFLRVKDVRVEQLQNIDGHGILAEGVDNGSSNPTMGERWENMQQIAFQELWDSTIKPKGRDRYGWNANPWVWVIEFERIDVQS